MFFKQINEKVTKIAANNAYEPEDPSRVKKSICE